VKRSAPSSVYARDAVPALSLFAALQLLLPTRYVVGSLGAAGAPARLVGLGIALWWLTDWLGQPWPPSRVKQPLKAFAFVFVAAVLASYLVGAQRPTSQTEILAADRSVLNVLAWVGLSLAAIDAIPSRARLDTLLRRVVLFGSLVAGLGIAQFITGQSLIQYLKLPGLVDKGVDDGIQLRGSFVRPSGTATHPLEFGVTLSMLLPIALHYAVSDAGRRSSLSRWLPAALIAVALPLSISRSAIICVGVAIGLLLISWPRRLRRGVYAVGTALLLGLAGALPGFLRTFLELFTGMSNDSSTQSRTGSYALAWTFISRSPLFGRGTGTFLPQYRILDNQYLGSLIEIGFVGVLSLIAFFAAGCVTAWRLRPIASPASPLSNTPALAPALSAAIAGGAVSFAFFDAFSFAMTPSSVFLLIGCAGALLRLETEGDSEPPQEHAPANATSAREAPSGSS
jgi:O-antigen ligase